MAVTFQGGTSVPAVGTPAYSAAQTQTGTGNFTPSTGKLAVTSPASPVSPTTSAQNNAGGSVVSPYAVLTSAPATANYSAIQNDYTNNIQPNMQAAQTNASANNQLPVIPGYNVSPIQTGALGETKATNNATGQSYYIAPQKPALSASDVQGMLNAPQTPSVTPTGVTAPSTGSASTQTPSDVATQQTGVNPTTENQNYSAAVTGAQTDMDTAYAAFKSTIQQIQSGSFPLSGAQQALVDATNQAFEQMTTQSELKAAALSSQTGGVSDKVNATAGEMTNIISAQAAAVAKLEIGFQQQNYQMVTDSYNEFRDYETQKMSALNTLHTSVMDAYNTAIDTAQKQQAFVEQQKKDAADIANQQANQKIQAADEALKAEQVGIQAATFNATYGQFMNADGSTNTAVTPQSLPGYTSLPNGTSVINGTNLPDAMSKRSNIGGIPVVPVTLMPVVAQWSNLQSVLNQAQVAYTQAKANNFIGQSDMQYKSLATQANAMISDLSGKNPQFSGLSGFYLPVLTQGGILDKGSSNFNSIRGILNNGISSIIPNYTAPLYGTVFSSPQQAQSYFTSTGQADAYNSAVQNANSLAQKEFDRNATDGEIMQVINGQ